jgi:hypothetical protein
MNDIQKLALAIAIVVGVFLYLQLLCYLISIWSGWRALAVRFRHEMNLTRQIGSWHSARMRYGCHYNNALKVAADEEGLSLSTIAIVPQHPPLLIPWTEIKVLKRRTSLFWTYVYLQLGNQERIPFAIFEKLFDQIKQQAPPNALSEIR